MHQVLMHAFEEFIVELEGVDTALSRLHPEGNERFWNVHQVTEHLVLTLRASRVQLEKRLEKGRISARNHRTRVEWLMQLMVLSLGHMPVGVPTTEDAEPATDLPAASGRELSRMLRAELEATDEVLDRCRQRFGMERVGRHFLLGPIRVDQWRRYHVVHLRHHAAQVRRIRTGLLVPVAQAKPVAARA